MAQKCACGLTAAAVRLEILQRINADFIMLGAK